MTTASNAPQEKAQQGLALPRDSLSQKRSAGFALASEPAGGRRLVLDSVVTVAGRDTAGGVEAARAGATFAVALVLAVVGGAG